MDLLRVSLAVVLLFRTRVPAIIITKDAHVTCLFLEDCVLPCSFWPTGTVVIHWYKQQIPVHSYYYNKDQYVLQNKHFSGRTNLFNSQISQGNASLVLRKVKVQDQGKYKCYTSTKKGNQETFVNLGVKAMIQFVKLEMLEQKVTCLSQNIYPAPGIFWFTDPPMEGESLQNFTHKMADSKGLFTVESSVNVTGNRSDHTYFCSVVSADGLQVWTASLRHQDDMFGEEGSGLTIPCVVYPPRQNFTLTWTFTGTEPTLIFSFDSRSRRITQPWESKAEVNTERARQGNGSLQLLAADSSTHTGRYTCVFRGVQTRHQVQTRVNITVRATEDGEKHCRRSWWGTAASVFLFLITVSVALARCFRLRGERTFHSHPDVNNRVKSGRKELSQFESRPNGLDHVEVETHPSAGLKTSTASDRLESSLPGATEPPAAARAPDLPKFQSSRFCCKPEQTHVNGFR